jgi:hypothetical protein
MAHRIRTLALGLAVCATLVVNAPMSRAAGESTERDAVPIGWDIPMRFFWGIPATAGGFVLFCVFTPMIAVTRPTDGFGKAWQAFVVHPAKFTWVDPAGRHPEYPDAEYGDTTPATGPGPAM